MSLTSHQQDDIITVTVLNAVSSGLIVKLDNGQDGFIRNRELTWERSKGHTRPEFEPGQRIPAVTLPDETSTSRVLLSYRRALEDPWDKVRHQEYEVGQVVTGEVVNLESYGAFVEIEPGLVGMLHIGQIPKTGGQEIQEVLWYGDYVKAKITKLDTKRRQIRLSINAVVKTQRGEFLQLQKDYDPKIATVITRLREKKASSNPKAPILRYQRIRRILIIDDGKAFAESLGVWLKRLDYQVAYAHSGQEALKKDHPYDLIFLDINLPDTIGPTLWGKINNDYHKTKVIFLTGEPDLMDDKDLLKEHPITEHPVLLKPLNYEEVAEHLAEAELDDTAVTTTMQQHPIIDDNANYTDRLRQSILQAESDKSAENILSVLCQDTSAESAVIFQVDTYTGEVIDHAVVGLKDEDVERDYLPLLRLSAVRDVAIDGDVLLENGALYVRRYDTLLRFVYFASCIGVPIPVSNPEYNYALFLFHSERNSFSGSQLQQTIAAAYLLAANIDKQQLQEQLARTQRFYLLGQLISSLMHEQRNQLTHIDSQAQLLKGDCEAIKSGQENKAKLSWAEEFGEYAEGILKACGELHKLYDQYLGLMQQQEPTDVHINALLRVLVEHLEHLARRNHINLKLKLDPAVPLTRTLELKLMQVLLNIILNAIQLMGAQYPGYGNIEITSHYAKEDNERPIKIYIRDHGPGIHRKQWEWIFKLGTTTREGGTGLGLFVSKSLLESINGTLTIEESHMFVGTTFLITLPHTKSQEATHA